MATLNQAAEEVRERSLGARVKLCLRLLNDQAS
jgi:hypothetical protein